MGFFATKTGNLLPTQWDLLNSPLRALSYSCAMLSKYSQVFPVLCFLFFMSTTVRLGTFHVCYYAPWPRVCIASNAAYAQTIPTKLGKWDLYMLIRQLTINSDQFCELRKIQTISCLRGFPVWDYSLLINLLLVLCIQEDINK